MPTYQEQVTFRREVLTARQAAEYLHVTPGRIASLVSAGKLVPILKEGRVTLFLREDVENYSKDHPPRPDGRRRKPVPSRVQRFIAAESFDLIVSTFREARGALDDVVDVSVYFWRWDAVRNGLYWAEDPLDRDAKFWPVRAATLMVRDIHGYEVWVEHANCGYRGEFPATTHQILTDIGIPEALRNAVDTRQILQYHRASERDPWAVDDPDQERLTPLTPESRWQTPMFWSTRRDALALFGDPASLNGPFLTHYQQFLGHPQAVYVFPAGQGVVRPDAAGRPWEYTVMIDDKFGHQLWLVPLRSIPESWPTTLELREIFDGCGISLDSDGHGGVGRASWLSQRVEPMSFRLATV